MADISFSMSADEKDVTRALQNLIKENAKLRAEMTKAADDSKKSAKEATAAEMEHTKAVKEATAVAEKYQTKQEKAAAEIKRLNDLKAKGVLTSRDHARALAAENAKLTEGGQAAETFSGALGPIAQKLTAMAAGFVSLSAVITTVRAEYDALIDRQGKSRDANLSLAAEQEALLMNLGDANAQEVTGKIRGMSKKTGVKEENITRAVNEAMAARADLSVADVLQGVESSTKVRKFAPQELASIAGATIDTSKQTGLGMDASLGFLMQLQAQSRTKNLRGLAENFTPAVGGIMQFGADRQTAGGILAALSHGMGDTQGSQSATSGIRLAEQLREYGRKNDPALVARQAALETQQENEKKTLEHGLKAQSISLSAMGMDPQKKRALQLELQEEYKLRKEELKARHGAESGALADSGRNIPVGQVLERMVADPQFRANFLKGKQDGGFGATFEAKALPAIESLLSGGKQFQQYRSARSALMANPEDTLAAAVKARDLPAMNIAELDQRMGNKADQMVVGNEGGAISAVARTRIGEIREAMGRSRFGNKMDALKDDFRSGGNQSIDSAIGTLEGMKNSIESSERHDASWKFKGNLRTEEGKAEFERQFAETEAGKNEKLLEQLIVELQGLRDDQKAKAHAGVIGNKAGGN